MENNQESAVRGVAIAKALAEIKGGLTAVKKDSENGFIGNRFASLNAHLQAIEPLVSQAGCVLTQSIVGDARNGRNLQRTELIHVDSGESKESFVYLPELNDMQKLGSAITYARRYTLSALFGMQAEDDDGNVAVGKVNRKSKGASKAIPGDF